MRPYYGSIENKKIFMYDRNQAQRKLGIGKSQYYAYLKATGIKPERRDGRTTITQAELDILLAYKESLNAPSESTSETANDLPESQSESIAPMPPEKEDSPSVNPLESQPEKSQVIPPPPPNSDVIPNHHHDDIPVTSGDSITDSSVEEIQATPDIPVAQGGELSTDSGDEFPVLYEEEIISEFPTTSMDNLDLSDESDLDALIRIAQAKKAKQILQPELVMAHLVEQMTEDDLPEDLRRKIEQTRRAIRDPLANPAAIASQILTKYRSGSIQKT